MEFRQLKAFVTIYDCGSISKAAEKLYFTQQAMSQCIKGLELEVCCKLFERTTHGVVPTAIANELINEARRLCLDYDKFLESAFAFQSLEEVVRIGFIRGLLPPNASLNMGYLKEIAFTKLGIRVEFSCHTATECVELLKKGEIELALIVDHENSTPLCGLSSVTIRKLQPIAMISSKNKLCKKKNIALKDSAQLSLAVPKGDDVCKDSISALFRSANIENPNILIHDSLDLYFGSLIQDDSFALIAWDSFINMVNTENSYTYTMPSCAGNFRERLLSLEDENLSAATMEIKELLIAQWDKAAKEKTSTPLRRNKSSLKRFTCR